MASSYHRYAGGAVTILLAAARSGASCVHAGAVGTGPNGDLVRAALAAEGVEVSSPAGGRGRHRRVRGARRAHRRALLRHHPGGRAPDHRRVARGQRPGGRRPGVRQRLLARRTHPRPPRRVARHPRPRCRRRARPGGRLRRARRRPCATACWPARRCGPGTPTRRRHSPGCTACTRPPRSSRPCSPPDAVTIVRDGPRGCAVREGGARPVPAGPPAAPGRHQRRRGHAHRGAPRGAGRGGHVVARRRPRERRGSHQGDPSRPRHRAHPGGDRRLPGPVNGGPARHPVKQRSADGKDMVRTQPWRWAPGQGRMAHRARPSRGRARALESRGRVRRHEAGAAGVAFEAGCRPCRDLVCPAGALGD